MLGTRPATDEFTATFAQVATSVAVVTTLSEEGAPVGVTVGSLTSVSLDPPLLLVCLGREMYAPGAIARRGAFAVSVLGEDQSTLADRFAGLVPGLSDRFDGLAVSHDDRGMPLLPGCVAWLGCDLWTTQDGGDHLIVLGRVRQQRRWPRRPLLRHDRRWGSVLVHGGGRQHSR